MSTKNIVIDDRAAVCRMRTGLAAAPRFTHVLGSESAYATLGNPFVGTDAVATDVISTDVMGIVRVRDAKQAAPPRGELR